MITAGMVVAASIALQSPVQGFFSGHPRGHRGGLSEGGEAVSRVGHSLWKASEIDSDQTLHVYIVKHDPFGPAKVVVGVSIALHALLFALSRDLPPRRKISPPTRPSLSQPDMTRHSMKSSDKDFKIRVFLATLYTFWSHWRTGTFDWVVGTAGVVQTRVLQRQLP